MRKTGCVISAEFPLKKVMQIAVKSTFVLGVAREEKAKEKEETEACWKECSECTGSFAVTDRQRETMRS